MKKVKKILAALLVFVMMMGMSVTTFAAPQGVDKIPREADTVTVKIEGITGNATVTLYQIAKGVYGPEKKYLIRYDYAEGITLNAKGTLDLTSGNINGIAEDIQKEDGATGKVTPLAVDVSEKVNGTYTKEVSAGAYIAVITGDETGYVYNAILLTATYNEQGILEAGEINAAEDMYGTTATAKKTRAKLDKTVTGTVDEADSDRATASVGDVLHYTITPTMPTYPVDAVNKTFFVSDTMSNGLTFDYSTLTLTIEDKTIVKSQKMGDESVTQFVMDGAVIAESVATIKPADGVVRPVTGTEKATGFYLNFKYDNLFYDTKVGEGTSDEVTITGNVYTPVITYDAVLNEDAVAGGDGNTNDAKLYYTNNPNKGQNHDDPKEEPDGDTAVTSNENNSSKTVYTYQLAFHKTKEAGADLADAVFGIYKTKTGDGDDAEVSDLIDIVRTNEKGLAVSSKVGAGTYYIKEIAAPTGYSLNDKIYEIEAGVSSSTTTVTTTRTETKYTTNADDAIDNKVVGYIKDGVFYKNQVTDSSPAYVLSSNASDSSITTTTGGAGGTTMLGENIPNTKLSALPSTGGIGTTIFTVGGCALMIIAAGLYFAARRKNAK